MIRGPVGVAARLAEVPSLPRAQLALETAREVDRLVVDESARLDLVWVRVLARTGPAVTVVLAEQAATVASPALALSRLVAAGPGRRWTTAAAGTVRWDGPAIQPGSGTDGLATTASNDLLVGQVGNQPAILKAFRLLGSDRGEGRVLAALGGRLTPRLLAEVSYQPPHAGPALPLALITERLAGRTLDRPLLASLRQAWWAESDDLDPHTEHVLTRIRSEHHAFRAALAQACEPAPEDPAAAGRFRRVALGAEIQVLAQDLPTQPSGLAAVLAAAAASVAGLHQPIPGPAHGDLHLANVLLGQDRVCFLDVGLPEPGFCAADDGAALRRAVECLALDVLVDRTAGAQGRLPLEVVDDLVAAAVAGGPGNPLESAVPAELTAARRWLTQVCDLLDPWGAERLNLPYLDRLVHDLRYHTDRGDRYYSGLAWYHLVQAVDRLARTSTQAAPA
ncbi:MAG TPA: hypothetical protein VH298_07810 [Jatrophihabitans sp.]|nr:hypothetical protein [Jatrophihabitans sp.]